LPTAIEKKNEPAKQSSSYKKDKEKQKGKKEKEKKRKESQDARTLHSLVAERQLRAHATSCDT